MSALRAFEAAARLLSFKDAANELCVTPAAVSHQINKLEEELGTHLFRRFNRRVELTDSGVKYLTRLQLAFDDVENATRDLVQRGEGELISLAVPPMLLKMWIIPNLTSFYETYPKLKLRLPDTLKYMDFEKDHIDCAIRYGFGGWKGIDSEYLFAENMCPVCSPSLLKGKKTIIPNELVNFRLIYTERRLVQWDNYLTAEEYRNVNSSGQLWFLNSIHTIEAALSGLGIALVNRLFIQNYLKTGELIIPFELEMNFERQPSYYFVAPKQNRDNENIIAIHQWIKSLEI